MAVFSGDCSAKHIGSLMLLAVRHRFAYVLSGARDVLARPDRVACDAKDRIVCLSSSLSITYAPPSEKLMCRNIKTLYNFDPPATEEEIRAAAVQFVRKISGSTKPSRANEAAFERAVQAVSSASHELLATLVTSAAPRSRAAQAATARARIAKRFAGA